MVADPTHNPKASVFDKLKLKSQLSYQLDL